MLEGKCFYGGAQEMVESASDRGYRGILHTAADDPRGLRAPRSCRNGPDRPCRAVGADRYSDRTLAVLRRGEARRHTLLRGERRLRNMDKILETKRFNSPLTVLKARKAMRKVAAAACQTS